MDLAALTRKEVSLCKIAALHNLLSATRRGANEGAPMTGNIQSLISRYCNSPSLPLTGPIMLNYRLSGHAPVFLSPPAKPISTYINHKKSAVSFNISLSKICKLTCSCAGGTSAGLLVLVNSNYACLAYPFLPVVTS